MSSEERILCEEVARWIGKHVRPITSRSDGHLLDLAVSAPTLLTELARLCGVPREHLERVADGAYDKELSRLAKEQDKKEIEP